MKKDSKEKEVKKIKVILTRDIIDAEVKDGKLVRVHRKVGTEMEIDEGYLEPQFYIACDSLEMKELKELEAMEARKKVIEDEFYFRRAESLKEREKITGSAKHIAEERVRLATIELEKQTAIFKKLQGE